MPLRFLHATLVQHASPWWLLLIVMRRAAAVVFLVGMRDWVWRVGVLLAINIAMTVLLEWRKPLRPDRRWYERLFTFLDCLMLISVGLIEMARERPQQWALTPAPFVMHSASPMASPSSHMVLAAGQPSTTTLQSFGYRVGLASVSAACASVCLVVMLAMVIMLVVRQSDGCNCSLLPLHLPSTSRCLLRLLRQRSCALTAVRGVQCGTSRGLHLMSRPRPRTAPAGAARVARAANVTARREDGHPFTSAPRVGPCWALAPRRASALALPRLRLRWLQPLTVRRPLSA